jgi:hypothetical protein
MKYIFNLPQLLFFKSTRNQSRLKQRDSTLLKDVRTCLKDHHLAFSTRTSDRQNCLIQDGNKLLDILIVRSVGYCSDSRKGKSSKISLEEARQQFIRQAETLSRSGVEVRAFILNTALR